MIFLILGLLGLWIGTNGVIKGALGIADRFHLSHSFVGMAILAVGTDLPEVFVTLKASFIHLKGVESSGIITGNAIGSSFSQITIILGIAGLVLNIKMPREEWMYNATVLLASIALLFFLGRNGTINRPEGALLLAIYLVYYMLLLKNRSDGSAENKPVKSQSGVASAVFLVGGLVVLIFSSHLVVSNAMLLAENWGVAQSFVGIVLIGLGTSLPELVVSIGAAMRKSVGMSIGNIIGSNIFDGLVPIGLGGLISTTTLEKNLLKFDLPALFGVSLLVLLYLRTQKGISKFESLALIFVYCFYIILKILFKMPPA